MIAQVKGRRDLTETGAEVNLREDAETKERAHKVVA